MRYTIGQWIETALARLHQDGVIATSLWPEGGKLERPRDKGHGDFATNVAMLLAKKAGMKPRDLALRLIEAMPQIRPGVLDIHLAGPGFINFILDPKSRLAIINKIHQQKEKFGRSNVGAGQRVLLEFVSANPTGPMHVGHGRGAVVGDALARILTAIGCDVTTEYYVNDAGVQMNAIGRSLLVRYHELLTNQPIEMPPDCYPAEYVRDLAKELLACHGDRFLAYSNDSEAMPPLELIDFAKDRILEWIKDDLNTLNIHFDHWFSERSLHDGDVIAQTVAKLKESGWVYEGILDPPKGKRLEDWEQRPQWLFRSTHWGDDVDRPLQKSDGTYTYFAADIAYHYDKMQRGYHRLIDVWGADHGGYIKRVMAAIQALGGRKDLLDVKLVQMVNLTRGGVPVRMSKRAGTFETLKDLMTEVGRDAVRFWFLTRASDSQLDFDLDLAVTKSNDNPVYYVQYAHARVCSVEDKMIDREIAIASDDLLTADLSRLSEPEEFELAAYLDRFPEVIESSGLAHAPHQMAYYLLELSALFHTYYNSHRILDEDEVLRHARFSLIAAVRQVVANGLELLGVESPRHM